MLSGCSITNAKSYNEGRDVSGRLLTFTLAYLNQLIQLQRVSAISSMYILFATSCVCNQKIIRKFAKPVIADSDSVHGNKRLELVGNQRFELVVKKANIIRSAVLRMLERKRQRRQCIQSFRCL